jgi:hypothetical protein
MKVWVKSMPYRLDAEMFFYDNAGWSQAPGETMHEARTKSARELAQAELWAATTGALVFEWEDDPDADLSCQCGDDHGPAYGCMVRRKGEHDVLASLWGIQFGDVPRQSAASARVVEAELADEVLAEIRANDLLMANNPELRALVAYAS